MQLSGVSLNLSTQNSPSQAFLMSVQQFAPAALVATLLSASTSNGT